MDLFSSYYYSDLHQALIMTHVLGAILSLFVAPLAMVVKKGKTAHRRWGKIYFWGMFITNMSAFWLLYWRFNIFLLGVTFLSFYGAVSGYRVVYRKRPLGQPASSLLDWLPAGLAALGGATLILFALSGIFFGRMPGVPLGENVPVVFIILSLVFGSMVTGNAISDIRHFVQPKKASDKLWWWYYHMDRMLGSYVALFTALMVQQVGPRLPGSVAWMVWIAPGIIGSIGITYWIKSYRRKFAGRKSTQTPLVAETA